MTYNKYSFELRDRLAGARYAQAKLAGTAEPPKDDATPSLAGDNARALLAFALRTGRDLDRLPVAGPAKIARAIKHDYLCALVEGGFDADRVDARIRTYLERYGAGGKRVFALLQ